MVPSFQPISQSTVPADVAWLWRPYVARGKLTLLDGDPGCGKSLVTVDLVARLSRGLAFPDGSATPAPCAALILSVEDDPADTIRPRLLAAGADLDRVFVPAAEGRMPQLPRDLRRLEGQIRELGVGLVVLDSLTTLLPSRLSTGPTAAVRRVIAPIIQLAIRTNIGLVLVRHLTKKQQARAVYRGLGSVGIAGLARTVLLAGSHPTDPSARALTVLKSNLIAVPAPLGYRLGERDGTAVVEWLGPAAGGLTPDEPAARPEAPGVVRATVWLTEALATGPRPVVELLLAAKAAGIRERTLEVAKKQTGVISKLSHSKDGRKLWCWCPPGYGDKPFLPPLEFELEPLDDPSEEILPDDLSPEAKDLLDRDRLAWALRVLK